MIIKLLMNLNLIKILKSVYLKLYFLIYLLSSKFSSGVFGCSSNDILLSLELFS